MPQDYARPDPKFIKQAFDSISPNYDRLNQILSFGQADRWREKACEILLEEDKRGLAPFLQEKVPVPLPEKGASPQTILDLGCGTGKFLECFLKRKSWDQAVGLDFSPEMLKKAKETVAGNAIWIEESFDKLPFLDGSFDLVISGFTLRSVQDMPAFLKEVHRVLSAGGKVAFLDLTRPRNILHKMFFLPYLKIVLPALGYFISGNDMAYRFLSQSVENFQTPDRTLEFMKQAGFRDLSTKSFSFGASTLMIGAK